MTKRLKIFTNLYILNLVIIYFILLFLISFLGCFYFIEKILFFLSLPLINVLEGQLHFIYTDITQLFLTYLISCFYISIYISYPIILVGLFIFLIPGLYKYEKIYMGRIILLSIFLMLIGGLICYKIILPIIIKFFFSLEIFNSIEFSIEFQPKINEYILFIIRLIFLFSLFFQLPLIIILLIDYSYLNEKFIIKKRHYFIIISLILGALLSPPDVLSQLIFSLLFIILYEISIIILKIKYFYNLK